MELWKNKTVIPPTNLKGSLDLDRQGISKDGTQTLQGQNKMFGRICQFFRRSFYLKREFEAFQILIKREIEGLAEQMAVLSKVALQRESKLIENYFVLWSLHGDVALREERMQKKRDELRLEGYSFCYKKKNGDEIWVKY